MLLYLSESSHAFRPIYKVVQIWPGLFVCKQVTVCPGHILNTLYQANIWKHANIGSASRWWPDINAETRQSFLISKGAYGWFMNNFLC
jgi:hypothetical protein